MNLLALGVLALVASDPVVEERTEYYDVTGSSALELYNAVLAHGPKGAQGVAPWTASFGTTSWNVRTQAEFARGDGLCAIKSVRTTVRIVTVLPRWTNRVEGTPTAKYWDRTTRRLVAHERRHAEHGILAATAIRDTVPALSPARTCRELDAAVSATSNAIIERYRGEDRVFDVVSRQIPFEAETEDERAALPAPLPSPAPTDTPLTETERLRRAGAAYLEAEMAALSELADRAGAAWQRYRAACPSVTTVGGSVPGGREWFAHAWPGSRSAGQTTECIEAQEFYALADEVKQGICRADERARRAFVYPGTRRDLLARFGLDWSGWDRACP
jgi:predicted secreted Zn-dependent protease